MPHPRSGDAIRPNGAPNSPQAGDAPDPGIQRILMCATSGAAEKPSGKKEQHTARKYKRVTHGKRRTLERAAQRRAKAAMHSVGHFWVQQ